jgi:pyrroline-5-carboxylate reductase
MRLGFIGTGRITMALVEAFCTTADPPSIILVSPRNAERAAQLAARFREVTVARDNQTVVDGTDCIFLALRPPMVSALGELRFRPEHQIISLIPTRPFTQISVFVEPARQLAWALPLPSVARHVGPVAIYPGASFAVDLLARVGTPLVVHDLEHLRILWASTALVSPFFALMEEMSQWATDAGVGRAVAGPYIAAMFHALSALAMEIPDGRYSGLVADAATPGGLNEQALAEIRQAGGHRAFLNALDSILTRLGGTPSGREQPPTFI